MVLSDAISPHGFHAKATPSLVSGMARGHNQRRQNGAFSRWLNGGIHSSNLQQLLREDRRAGLYLPLGWRVFSRCGNRKPT